MWCQEEDSFLFICLKPVVLLHFMTSW
jgi:hypothetical protein